MVCEDCYTLLHPRRVMMHLRNYITSGGLVLSYETDELYL